MPVQKEIDRMKVNPARAGMIPSLDISVMAMAGKPRASGDDP